MLLGNLAEVKTGHECLQGGLEMTATEIGQLLASRAESVCAHLLPGGSRHGREWLAGSTTGQPGASLHVILDGEKSGMWRDFAGDESEKGDLLGLWKACRRVDLSTACKEALDWLGVPENQRNGHGDHKPAPPTPKPTDQRWLDLQESMRKGTQEDLDALAALRGIPSIHGLELASESGHLFFGDVIDRGERHPAWILTDDTRRNAQARKMDGGLWLFKEGSKPSKSKTIWGTDPKWPVGIDQAITPEILLVEGGPDLLAAWHFIHATGRQDRCRPVAMFGVSNPIHPDALPHFKDKTVWIFVHNDDNGAGLKGATKWSTQIKSAGAKNVQLYDFKERGVKDLNELIAQPGLVMPELIITAESAVPKTDLIGRPLGSFTLPDKSDPSILIGNRWLSRGDIFILASTSGMGKSSLSIQAAVTWALSNKLFDGFAPTKPLKSLIFQAEDGDGDIAEVRLSMEHAMNLTPEEKAQVDQNVIIITDRIHRGLSFRSELKNQILIHKPDIVWINPLLAFIGGDVNDSTDVGAFLREQLNSLNEPPQFAYGIVHHTSKPPKERKTRQWNEIMYEMAGSADLTNAARAILALQATETHGEFKLIAAKRGPRAGLTTRVPGTINPEIKFDQPTNEIDIRHSKDRMQVNGQDLAVIYWERFEKGTTEVTDKPKQGRKPSYFITDFHRWIPTGRENALPAQQIWRNTNNATGITDNGFKKLLFRASQSGEVYLTELPNKGACYHL